MDKKDTVTKDISRLHFIVAAHSKYDEPKEHAVFYYSDELTEEEYATADYFRVHELGYGILIRTGEKFLDMMPEVGKVKIVNSHVWDKDKKMWVSLVDKLTGKEPEGNVLH